MKKIEMAKLAMNKTVLKVLDEHPGNWSALAPVNEEVKELRFLVEGIDADLETQTGTASTGFTSQKNRAFDEMLDQAYKMALKLKTWAKKKHNDVVFKAANYRRYQLAEDTETEKLSRCKLILSKAEENISAMAGYNLTAGEMDALRTAIELAAALSVNRDAVGTTRQVATGNIGDKIKATSIVLKDLDDLIEGLTKKEDADFVAAYAAARKTVNHKGSNEKKTAPVKVKQDISA